MVKDTAVLEKACCEAFAAYLKNKQISADDFLAAVGIAKIPESGIINYLTGETISADQIAELDDETILYYLPPNFAVVALYGTLRRSKDKFTCFSQVIETYLVRTQALSQPGTDNL